MSFPYKHVLIIGATSGIGRGMAERFLEAGKKVTIVGRRQERLDEFVAKYENSKVNAVAFDIGDLDGIPGFAAKVMQASPDIDSIFLNAGTQSHYDFSQPSTVDLPAFNQELKINFTSQVALTHAFLPFLLAQETPTSFLFTGTHLAIVPASTLPAYSASKGALNIFVLCLRDQLRNTRVKVIDIYTPPVQTELHGNRKFGMPLEEFTKEVYSGLAAGKDEVIIGTAVTVPELGLREMIATRRRWFDGIARLLNGGK